MELTLTDLLPAPSQIIGRVRPIVHYAHKSIKSRHDDRKFFVDGCDYL